MQSAPHPPVTRREGLLVAVLTAVFGLWLVLWALVVPAFQAPDEPAHFDAVVHVATGSGWPAPGTLHVSNAVLAAEQEQAQAQAHGDASAWSTMSELLSAHPGDSTTVNQMTQHPPTAYAVDAVVLRALHYGSLRWDHALVALRLFDALLVTPLALLAWAAVRRVTRSPRAALVAPLALFATPQLASIGASVTNDAPVLLLGGAVVWLATRLLTGDLRTRTLVALGVVTAALVWTKGTGLPAVPVTAVVTLVAGAGVLPVARRVVRTVVVLAVTAVLGAWWWLHNLVTYHRLQPDGYAAIRPHADFPPGSHPSPLHFADVSWGTMARTFWGSPGQRAQVSIGDLLTAVLTIVAVLVVLLWAFRRPRSGPDTRAAAWSLAVFPVLLLALQTASSARAYLDTTQVAGTQGRYLFPALLALVVLSAVAWRRIPRTAGGRRGLAAGVAVVAPAVGLYGLAVVASWFWNAARFPVTVAGVARYQELGPVPFALVVVVAVLVAVGLTLSVERVARWSGPGGTDRLPRSAAVGRGAGATADTRQVE
ncbi:Predicted membrane protein [Curtobacterium sp. UNCCL20]|uniref:DUF2142 domain-containing protein n=1 Tax=Curtobacterium sp. UNCCL20 TaxID=1502773 RepID=UPI00087E281B|nr:DUF2142 domain-containing protein [Curtobacterium sp. UNCCL20]SDQ72900.1 Predicted membrane protein [Curtobacterium sp. UNCCL20]